MELLVSLLPTIFLVAVIVVLVVLAGRSLKRQRGGKLRRGRKESDAAGRMPEVFTRWW
ncbi:MAG TPA: hypothetical protein VLI94_02035 [Solirubrobacterales bacterium]|nr:hypothetical protein [Solirubrobacterales bacterium]